MLHFLYYAIPAAYSLSDTMGRELCRDRPKKRISASRKKQLQQAGEKRHNQENNALVTDVVPLECSSDKAIVLKTVVTKSPQARIAVENKLQEVQAHQANEQAECFKILRLEWQNVRRSKDRLLKVLRKVRDGGRAIRGTCMRTTRTQCQQNRNEAAHSIASLGGSSGSRSPQTYADSWNRRPDQVASPPRGREEDPSRISSQDQSKPPPTRSAACRALRSPSTE